MVPSDEIRNHSSCKVGDITVALPPRIPDIPRPPFNQGRMPRDRVNSKTGPRDIGDSQRPDPFRTRERWPAGIGMTHALVGIANTYTAHPAVEREVQTHQRVCDADVRSVTARVLRAVCVDHQLVEAPK